LAELSGGERSVDAAISAFEMVATHLMIVLEMTDLRNVSEVDLISHALSLN
jgi:hypothetical protein